MHNELKTLTDLIVEDYANWSYNSPMSQRDATSMQIAKDMVKKFGESIRIEHGSKYTKIVVDGRAWGFVVNTAKHPKFKFGDILKAATWRAPATNKARGNIMSGDFSWVLWTGPKYL